MNSWNWPESTWIGDSVGWTIIHSFWQLSLIALGVHLMLRLVPNKRPKLRYALLLVGLSAAVIWPGWTYYTIWLSSQGELLVTQEIQMLPTAVTSEPAIGTTPGFRRYPELIALQLQPYLPALTIAWLLGVLFFSCYTVTGVFYLKYLAQRQIVPTPAHWQARFETLQQQAGIRRRVRLLVSELVDGPLTYRLFRPVILMPVSLFSGLTPVQVEGLLLHELAHIRRHDFLVNIFQSLVEILFFYHPAVWWISGKIREEREYCCDDFVMNRQGDPMAYAEALATGSGKSFFNQKKISYVRKQ